MTDLDYLRLAIEQAKKSIASGGFPAGAILVKDNKIISSGISIGLKLNDPTSHAETCSIREACKELETIDLSGAIMYSSMEPCLMCFSVANWVGVSKVVFACKKTESMIKNGYYEGANSLDDINKLNNRQIEIIYIKDLEDGMLNLINEWEKSI